MNKYLNKLKQIIYALRYVTEFIISFIVSFLFLNIIYVKQTYGYYSRLYIIGTLIWFMIFMINFIYNFYNSKRKIEHIFLNIAIPLGILYIVFMIPRACTRRNSTFHKSI